MSYAIINPLCLGHGESDKEVGPSSTDLRPDDVYYDTKLQQPDQDAKTVPVNIEQHLFQETRITGYRLKSVA